MQVSSKKTNKSARLLAINILCSVIDDHRSLTFALSRCEELDDRDKAFCKELCYGTLRWHGRLQSILHLLLKKPFKPKDSDINVLALCGLYQLIYLNTPDHAAVSETVNTSIALKKPWAKNTLNAVLRRFLRERNSIEQQTDRSISQQYAHPHWLVDALKNDWPDRVETILHANNQRPPMSIRVNAMKNSREDYLAELEKLQIEAKPHPFNSVGLTLKQAVSIESLPDFLQGSCSVQDGAAQLAASLLNVSHGQHVLDVCAAPGGKAAHLLETTQNDITLTAIDIDEERNQKVLENLERLTLNASVLSVDGCATSEWFDGKPFQRILLDAPCSATGVIRRHPDIKLLRQEDDIAPLVELQQHLLDAIWPLLETNGVLLYATCSILSDENSNQIERFMAKHQDAQEIPINADWGRACNIGRQILPGDDTMDGFYYALLTKTNKPS